MGGRGSSGTTAPRERSLDWVGRLQSGNEAGMTVAAEYHQKEVLGNYSANDWARARAAGQTPREYQAEITEHIRKHGQLTPAQASEKTLDEGYHRYAAARALGKRTMKVKNGYG